MNFQKDPIPPSPLRRGLMAVSCLSLLGLSSCVVPLYPDGPPPVVATGGVGYYSTLPSGYAGDAYYYGGRYYYGGNLQVGTYFYNGRRYSDRYFHNGHYYYGGRHQHYGPPRRVYSSPRGGYGGYRGGPPGNYRRYRH